MRILENIRAFLCVFGRCVLFGLVFGRVRKSSDRENCENI